jgi:hypothetical protein
LSCNEILDPRRRTDHRNKEPMSVAEVIAREFVPIATFISFE